jgi:hypothetical protein
MFHHPRDHHLSLMGCAQRRFYYHSKTRESSWEIPEGARVTYMEGGETGEGSASKRAKKDGTSSMWVLVGLLVPIVLPLLGLAACYWQATREGLAEALKELGKRRERARKRRGSKAGSNFKQRQKLSQDGKGGRSANS